MPIKIFNAKAAQTLQGFFDYKGKHDLKLDEIIVPVAIVADLSGDEALGQSKFVLHIQSPAVAATTVRHAYFNGVANDTGVDVVVDKIVLSSAANSVIVFIQTQIAPINPTAAAVINNVWRQWPQVGTPPGTGFSNDAAMGGTTIYQADNLARVPAAFYPDITLGAQRGLSITQAIANTAFQTTWYMHTQKRT